MGGGVCFPPSHRLLARARAQIRRPRPARSRRRDAVRGARARSGTVARLARGREVADWPGREPQPRGHAERGRNRPGAGARRRAAARVALVRTCERFGGGPRGRGSRPGRPPLGLGGPSAGSLAGGRTSSKPDGQCRHSGPPACGPGGGSAISRGPEPAAAARDPVPMWRQLASRRASLAHAGGLAPRERRSVRETGRLRGREGRSTAVGRGRTRRGSRVSIESNTARPSPPRCRSGTARRR